MGSHLVALLLLILPALALGCTTPAPSPRETPGMAEGEEGGLKLSVKLGKPSYRLAEPVTMTFTVTNVSQTTFQENLGTSQVYDFLVTREGKEVWRWSANQLFLQVITQFSLAPGQSRQYRETWKQVDNEGRGVPPGLYQVVGLLKTRPDKSSPTSTFQIR